MQSLEWAWELGRHRHLVILPGPCIWRSPKTPSTRRLRRIFGRGSIRTPRRPAQLAEGARRIHNARSEVRARWVASGKLFIEEERSRTVLAQRLEGLLNDVSRVTA